MAMKLSKQEVKDRDMHVDALREGQGKLVDAIREFNEALEKLRDPLRQAIHDYNETLANANQFLSNLTERVDQELEGKSERWQNSEKGEAAAEWRSALGDVSFSDVDVDLPEDVSEHLPDDHAEELEQLPEEPEGV
jgi:DNA anti-recombination protein RmuC